MLEQDKQLGLFSEADFTSRNLDKDQLTGLDQDAIRCSVISCSVHCYYYIGAGNCQLHGDAIGCEDCDDFRSIVEEDRVDNE